MQSMTALEFLRAYGVDRAGAVAERAGSNMAYYRQIAYGHRRPSVELARRLAEASGHRLTVAELLGIADTIP